MTELSELFENLKELEPDAFAKALKEEAPKLYQFIWNGGHKTAFSEQQKTIDKLKSEVEDFDAERAKLVSKIDDLGKGQPDLKAMQERHEAALLAKDEAHKEAIEKAKKDAETWRGKYSDRNLDRVISDTVSYLVGEGVDRDYATVQVSKPGFRDRIRRNDDGEITGALQKDGQTPFPISDGQKIADVLGKEILSDVPEKWREDRRQRGAGIGDVRAGGKKRYRDEDFEKMSDAQVEAAEKEINEGRAELVA